MLRKTLKWVGNIIFFVLIIISLLMAYSTFQANKHPGQIPSVFGYQFMAVLSGSMEPLLEVGDLIIVKDSSAEDLKINDVITYKDGKGLLVTHRIVDSIDRQGKVFYQTKGDSNNIEDQEFVSSEQVVGSLQFHIPRVGSIADFLTSSIGIIILIMIPLIVLAIGILIKLLSNNKEIHHTKVKFKKGVNQ